MKGAARSPLTKVPLAVPRSTTQGPRSASAAKAAWRRLQVGCSVRTSHCASFPAKITALPPAATASSGSGAPSRDTATSHSRSSAARFDQEEEGDDDDDDDDDDVDENDEASPEKEHWFNRTCVIFSGTELALHLMIYAIMMGKAILNP